MYDHTFYKQVQISRSDIRQHIKWTVSLVILHMVTSIFLRALCGYIRVNILTLSPRGVKGRDTCFLIFHGVVFSILASNCTQNDCFSVDVDIFGSSMT